MQVAVAGWWNRSSRISLRTGILFSSYPSSSDDLGQALNHEKKTEGITFYNAARLSPPAPRPSICRTPPQPNLAQSSFHPPFFLRIIVRLACTTHAHPHTHAHIDTWSRQLQLAKRTDLTRLICTLSSPAFLSWKESNPFSIHRSL